MPYLRNYSTLFSESLFNIFIMRNKEYLHMGLIETGQLLNEKFLLEALVLKLS